MIDISHLTYLETLIISHFEWLQEMKLPPSIRHFEVKQTRNKTRRLQLLIKSLLSQPVLSNNMTSLKFSLGSEPEFESKSLAKDVPRMQLAQLKKLNISDPVNVAKAWIWLQLETPVT